MPRPDRQQPSPVIFEALPYWNHDTTTIDLVIIYRISPSFLFFGKSGTPQQESYEAKGELVVEILDENEVTVARDLRPIQVERFSAPTETRSSLGNIQGMFAFQLKRGIYRIVIEANDNESGKSFINRDTKVEVKTSSLSDLNISPILFVEPLHLDSISASRTKFIPLNHGGHSLIGQPAGCIFQVIPRDTSPFQISWKLTGNDKNDEDTVDLHGDKYQQFDGIPTPAEVSNTLSMGIKKDSLQSRIVYLPIPLERLDPGKYQLTISAKQNAHTSLKDFTFTILWPFKPISLSDPRVAVEALKHIASEEEIDRMSGLSSSKARKAFKEFWQKRSPDTTNAFNPAMAEYYRRVDETIRRFSVGNETDGYRTDRGRIYILFGSPTVTNRLLKPNTAPTEIWTYERLKQRFTFTDRQKTGNYILVKTESY